MDKNTLSQNHVNKSPSGPGYRPRDELTAGPGYRLRNAPPTGPGHRPRDAPQSGPVYRQRDESFAGPGNRPRNAPPSGPGNRPRYESQSWPGYRKREEAEEQRPKEETRQQQQVKLTDEIRNSHYSSASYESFQRELQKKQEQEYKEYLTKKEDMNVPQRSYQPTETTYGASFKPAPPTPPKIYHHILQSSALGRLENLHRSFQHDAEQENGFAHKTYEGQHKASILTGNNQDSGHESSQYNTPRGYMPKMPDYAQGNPQTFHQQMMAPFPKYTSAPEAKAGSPPATPSKLSLPLGQYDDMRPFIVKQRNREYNNIKEQIDHGPKKPPKTPETTALSLPIEQNDEIRSSYETLRNREYNAYLNRLPPVKNRVGITPEGTGVFLPVGQYEDIKKITEKQRNKEYNDLLQTGKIGKRSLRQKAPTPPELQGLPIGQQHHEPIHKAMEDQRNKEYNEFLKKKFGNLPSRTTRSGTEVTDKTSIFYGSDTVHNEKRKMLEEERKNEYNQFIKEQAPPRSRSIEIPSDVDSGLPIGQHHHESWKKFLREQRNREYNQLVDMKLTEKLHRDWNFDQDGILELRGDDAMQNKQHELRAERQKDYNNYISQQRVTNPSRRHEFVDTSSGPYNGLFNGLGQHGYTTELLNQQRKQEYNDQLTQKEIPHGRPSWVRDSLPNKSAAKYSSARNPPPNDDYQQMLDEKRREEANRRHFDDPEYQGRLVQADNSTMKYGY